MPRPSRFGFHEGVHEDSLRCPMRLGRRPKSYAPVKRFWMDSALRVIIEGVWRRRQRSVAAIQPKVTVLYFSSPEHRRFHGRVTHVSAEMTGVNLGHEPLPLEFN